MTNGARELKMRPATLRAWKCSGKLKPVDVGGKYPKFRRADIERIGAEGGTVLTKIARKPRVPRGSVLREVEPLESMLARAKQLAKEARERHKRDREGRTLSGPNSPSQTNDDVSGAGNA